MNKLTLENVDKNFGEVQAVDDLSFSVKEGEFFSILGPSGSGKTTTLRSITGFESITGGTIRINGESINHKPPNERNIGMVFQGYALFPHKTVGENVGYGLKFDDICKKERKKRVSKMLAKVGLPEMEDRKPEALSGGQQQRVALARALILEPEILVLDEPLSSLDRALRQQMRYELNKLHNDIDVTTIYVTHNQEEALALSDRILIMNDGSAEQIGTPEEIYYEPNNLFVAEFIGDSNILSREVAEMGDDVSNIMASTDGGLVENKNEAHIFLRPENMNLTAPSKGKIIGEIQTRAFHGSSVMYTVESENNQYKVESNLSCSQIQHNVGDKVGINWDQDTPQVV